MKSNKQTSGAARGVVILIGVLGAICSAGTNLLVRKLKHVHALLTIFYLMIAASFGSIIVAVIKQDHFLFPPLQNFFDCDLLVLLAIPRSTFQNRGSKAGKCWPRCIDAVSIYIEILSTSKLSFVSAKAVLIPYAYLSNGTGRYSADSNVFTDDNC